MEYGRRTSARSVYYINRYLNLCGVGTLVRVHSWKETRKIPADPGAGVAFILFFLLFLLFFVYFLHVCTGTDI